ncbi:MAG: hypothetical protein A2751_01745 [Candidatus Doudnabacteria bacterium RIFCSPHIGHO2_01_FULL_46_14]|uniref:Uncharacterized protein n=1 Tax=Candidatus Doudnabacteria bacterium RIFCSPHIGHO2_01_FULL_46_14 TaxID=1817824 RepID=A0A1F5NJE9_9BACT|nr:MAG: hypothetical protein A2751_01745 [Candidatus Doudnabacteria bacterium RIFCSPHIGHO2_01_FULL_46_14]
MNGTVVRVNAEQHWAFVRPDDGSEDVWLDLNLLAGQQARRGDQIEFDAGEAPGEGRRRPALNPRNIRPANPRDAARRDLDHGRDRDQRGARGPLSVSGKFGRALEITLPATETDPFERTNLYLPVTIQVVRGTRPAPGLRVELKYLGVPVTDEPITTTHNSGEAFFMAPFEVATAFAEFTATVLVPDERPVITNIPWDRTRDEVRPATTMQVTKPGNDLLQVIIKDEHRPIAGSINLLVMAPADGNKVQFRDLHANMNFNGSRLNEGKLTGNFLYQVTCTETCVIVVQNREGLQAEVMTFEKEPPAVADKIFAERLETDHLQVTTKKGDKIAPGKINLIVTPDSATVEIRNAATGAILATRIDIQIQGEVIYQIKSDMTCTIIAQLCDTGASKAVTFEKVQEARGFKVTPEDAIIRSASNKYSLDILTFKGEKKTPVQDTLLFRSHDGAVTITDKRTNTVQATDVEFCNLQTDADGWKFIEVTFRGLKRNISLTNAAGTQTANKTLQFK